MSGHSRLRTDKGPGRRPACRRVEGCITCSDQGTPMEVIEVDADRALAVCVDEQGARSDVMTDLVGPVSPGDRLLVHAGTALLSLGSGDGAPSDDST